ncbi:hypothetical protein [Natronolimnohabitans innermongolicus]|uniref:Uncharacterized protein n=1 Tax=Natronolimnohabitans innermongolicus JCM 12255 TaxID=1227499 RepID=L9X7I3_9EURY|nr:hypothetical protein [Natronolimnohabitans innermongolicus]ELY57685.1 hypothetical protein C493_07334 [Natronolimnohabitans innermongolicus JCM 12255]
MANQTRTLMEDINQAHDTHAIHLWSAIITTVLSLFVLPVLGLVAAYSGFKLKNVMQRSWFGLLFAGLGLVSVISWLLLLAAWQLGYVDLAV